jgi:hypothetical protein
MVVVRLWCAGTCCHLQGSNTDDGSMFRRKVLMEACSAEKFGMSKKTTRSHGPKGHEFNVVQCSVFCLLQIHGFCS